MTGVLGGTTMASRRWSPPRPGLLLGVVCALHAVSPLVLVGPRFWYEWDETVYISQVSRQSPAMVFTAPRARGLTLLLAPVTETTTSTAALRVYLAVLTGLGMYLAFRPWLRLLPGYLAPLAAALFSTLWVTIYYGFEAMPNIWVALGALVAVAYLLLALREPDRAGHLVWLGGALAFVGLVRPSDAVWLAAPLGLVAILAPGAGWRRRAVLAAVLAGGLALGWAEWVVEAYARYGGLAARLHAASAENHGGLHMSLGAQARAVAGPTLCRPCTRPVTWPHLAWWFALPVLVPLGVVPARRRGLPFALPTLAGLFLLAEYLVTVDYAAPRFLLPSYALFAPAAAAGVAWLCRKHGARWRPSYAVPLVAAGLAVHTGLQLLALEHGIVPEQRAARAQYLAVARDLAAHGVRAPCVVQGYYSPPIAFAAGCANEPTRAAQLDAAARRTTVVILATGPAPPGAYYAGWPVHQVADRAARHPWYVYLRLHRDGVTP